MHKYTPKCIKIVEIHKTYPLIHKTVVSYPHTIFDFCFTFAIFNTKLWLKLKVVHIFRVLNPEIMLKPA